MPCLSCCWKKTGGDKDDAVVEEKDNGDGEGNFGNLRARKNYFFLRVRFCFSVHSKMRTTLKTLRYSNLVVMQPQISVNLFTVLL